MNNTTDWAQGLSVQYSLEVTAYLLTLVLGTGGNVLVLLVIIGRRHKRSVNDLFIANLATSDLAYLLFFLPLKTHAKLFGDPGASVAYCKFVYPMLTVTFSVGILTLTSMAVYRCYFVVNPFKAQLRHRTVLAWMIFFWLFSIVLTLPFIIVIELKNKECCEMWSDSSKKAYTVVLLILQCVLPLAIITAAYTRVAIDLLASNTARACLNQEGKVTTDNGRHENIKVIRTSTLVVLLFIVCMFPLQIAWLISQFGKEQVDNDTLNILFIFSDILSVIHACMNPIVYGTLTQHFRRGYIEYLSYSLCCCHQLLNGYHGSRRNSQDQVQLRNMDPTGENMQERKVNELCLIPPPSPTIS